MDSFYKVLTQEQHEAAEQNEYNFDHPDAFDFELLIGNYYLLSTYLSGEIDPKWFWTIQIILDGSLSSQYEN